MRCDLNPLKIIKHYTKPPLNGSSTSGSYTHSRNRIRLPFITFSVVPVNLPIASIPHVYNQGAFPLHPYFLATSPRASRSYSFRSATPLHSIYFPWSALLQVPMRHRNGDCSCQPNMRTARLTVRESIVAYTTLNATIYVRVVSQIRNPRKAGYRKR